MQIRQIRQNKIKVKKEKVKEILNLGRFWEGASPMNQLTNSQKKGKFFMKREDRVTDREKNPRNKENSQNNQNSNANSIECIGFRL